MATEQPSAATTRKLLLTIADCAHAYDELVRRDEERKQQAIEITALCAAIREQGYEPVSAQNADGSFAIMLMRNEAKT